jgi:NADPH-dependent curcumin reductase CurA
MRSAAISVDPSMIPRLQVATYAPAFLLGAAIEARAVGQVVRSADDGWAEGDWAVYWGGWRDLAVISAASALRIYPSDAVQPHMWLHVLGVPGLTAYVGLTQVARVQPGETVWVSAATGAVGSVAAQLAKARGAGRVIGSTGGTGKARYLTETLGLDAAVDYRASDLRSQLRQAAPDGIDVYFDNVGGDHLEAGSWCSITSTAAPSSRRRSSRSSKTAPCTPTSPSLRASTRPQRHCCPCSTEPSSAKPSSSPEPAAGEPPRVLRTGRTE